MTTTPHPRSRENRVRRAAQRQGLAIQKSRRRDPQAVDYGGYMLIDPYTNFVLLGAGVFAYSADLDDIEEFLKNRGQ